MGAHEVDWVAEVKIRNAIAHAIRQIDAEATELAGADPQNLEQNAMVSMVKWPDQRVGADPLGSTPETLRKSTDGHLTPVWSEAPMVK